MFVWREIDQQVRRLAKRRGKLDVEEAALLLAARGAGVHLHLGMGSFEAYLEQVLGYGPRKARERMRAAEALQELPRVRGLLEEGALSWSAVREVTRVATPETEQVWLEAIDGCNVREIEDAVSGRKRGDRPTDQPEPMPRRVRMELPPEVYAVFIEARRHLEREVGEPMTDAAFMSMVCRGVLAGEVTADPDLERAPSNVPPHQIALTVCVDCKRGWQVAGGRAVEVAPAAIERSRCDAVELGRVDGPVAEKTARSIPPRTRTRVLARDHHRCTVPGCRSSRFVEIHHIVWRSRRGDNRLLNLTTLCDAHHAAVHDGRLRITGVAGALVVRHADGRPYGTPPPPEPAGFDQTLIADARSALTGLGFRPGEASAAVAKAVSHVGQDVTLDALIRAALQRCPRPANHGP